jgi:inner membrane protein involved in colicin E2 resistance
MPELVKWEIVILILALILLVIDFTIKNQVINESKKLRKEISDYNA